MKVKPGMSDYQKKPWLNSCRCRGRNSGAGKRTATRGVKEIDETKELAIMHPHVIAKRNQDRNALL
jgi:hypothetical protein